MALPPYKRRALFGSALLVILYCGMPLASSYLGWLTFKNMYAAMLLVVVTAVVLIIQTVLVGLVTRSFTFAEHGFQLSLTAAAGFLTLLCLDFIDRSSESPRVLGLPDLSLLGGLAVTLVVMLVTAFIAERGGTGSPGAGARFLCYCLGAFAFLLYLGRMLWEVSSWKFILPSLF